MKRPACAYSPMNAPILWTSSIGGGWPASVFGSFLCMIMKRMVGLLNERRFDARTVDALGAFLATA